MSSSMQGVKRTAASSACAAPLALLFFLLAACPTAAAAAVSLASSSSSAAPLVDCGCLLYFAFCFLFGSLAFCFFLLPPSAATEASSVSASAEVAPSMSNRGQLLAIMGKEKRGGEWSWKTEWENEPQVSAHGCVACMQASSLRSSNEEQLTDFSLPPDSAVCLLSWCGCT